MTSLLQSLGGAEVVPQATRTPPSVGVGVIGGAGLGGLGLSPLSPLSPLGPLGVGALSLGGAATVESVFKTQAILANTFSNSPPHPSAAASSSSSVVGVIGGGGGGSGSGGKGKQSPREHIDNSSNEWMLGNEPWMLGFSKNDNAM